jgi:hypothetical protein
MHGSGNLMPIEYSLPCLIATTSRSSKHLSAMIWFTSGGFRARRLWGDMMKPCGTLPHRGRCDFKVRPGRGSVGSRIRSP